MRKYQLSRSWEYYLLPVASGLIAVLWMTCTMKMPWESDEVTVEGPLKEFIVEPQPSLEPIVPVEGDSSTTAANPAEGGDVTLTFDDLELTSGDYIRAELWETEPSNFEWYGPDGLLVRVNLKDGSVSYGKNYTPDAAARLFWETVGKYAPKCDPRPSEDKP